VNGIASISCDDLCVISCVTYVSPVKTTGLRLSHYYITVCVSTCDAWSPHVIYFTSAIRCNSLVFVLEGFKHDGDDDHHKTGRMAMEVTVESWWWSPLWCKRPYYSQYNMIICLWCSFTYHTILSYLSYGRYAFNHDRMASLIKVENFDILFQ
jgi:hypothetical protein